MSISDDGFPAWRAELLERGRIVQDSDDSVPAVEAERRSLRYVELVERVAGSEGQEVYQALLDSLQAEDDYGAYQAAFRALDRFPPERSIPWLVAALPDLAARGAERPGELLCALSGEDASVRLFNAELARASASTRTPILRFIRAQEDEGWLEDCPGMLGPEV